MSEPIHSEASQTVHAARSPIRVLIVDDHAVVRQGTRDMLVRDPAFEVVGESPSGEDLPGLIRLRRPDVLLLDINLPGRNGLQLFEDVRPLFPRLKIVFFSAHSEVQYIRKAKSLGADGFLSKTVTDHELRDALRLLLAEGQPVFSADVLDKLGSNVQNKSLFTARELEILQLVARGLTNQLIAKELCLSVKTVDTHVANLLKKTSLKTRTQLSAHAFEQGLV